MVMWEPVRRVLGEWLDKQLIGEDLRLGARWRLLQLELHEELDRDLGSQLGWQWRQVQWQLWGWLR